MTLSAQRLRLANDQPLRSGGDVVLYWMIGARRSSSSFALDRALELADELRRPLLVFEPLRAGYLWASDRHHAFVIEGMRDNSRAFDAAGVAYFPYLEPAPGAGRGLLAALAKRAAVVVTDEALGFFQPHMIAAAGRALDVRLEVVDGNGLLPVRAVDKAYPSAAHFRRLLQKVLPTHLGHAPAARPLARRSSTPRATVPDDVLRRWSPANLETPMPWRALAIDHSVPPSTSLRGGSTVGQRRLGEFLAHRLGRYEQRSEPDVDAASGLSSWLHFGHVGAHEVFAAVARHEHFDPTRAGHVTSGAKQGFWGMSANAEAFLDELVTWRELALNGALYLPGFDSFTLPAWAHASLDKHQSDPREQPTPTAKELDEGTTYDSVWNAAQHQLRAEGVMQNYLRMLWGKRVLAWSSTPRQAFETLVELNNRYALDGRDANSYAGIAWCFGRYDRPWPERAVFGVVRCMTSASAVKKLDMKNYLANWNSR